MTSPLAAAHHALTLASVHPEQAKDESVRVLRSADDEEARVVATRALALAYKELGNLPTALHHLERAASRADHARLPRIGGQVRMTLSAVLAERGDTQAALAAADRAAEVLTGPDAGRLLGQRAMILARAGRFGEALGCYRRALPRVHRAGDERFEAGMLLNRAALSVYVGRVARAESDLRRCEKLATGAGLAHMVALARWNMAFAAVRRGDIPGTLALLDDVEQRLEGSGERLAFARVERAEALIQANLVGEARGVLAPAIHRIEAGGFAADCAEARLMLARAELLDGLPQRAAGTADLARRAFVTQRRLGWAYLAEHASVMARWQRGERSLRLLRETTVSTEHLDRWGWEAAAARGRVVAGRLALALGEEETAEAQLTRAGRARTAGPVDVRAAAWHATALWRLHRGNRRGAGAALRAGLRVVDEHAGSLGATDLRVHAAGWGRELAGLGMQLALTSGRATTVFGWTERWRAGSTRNRPVQPPGEPRLAAALAELRRATANLGTATAHGVGTHGLRLQQVRLEDEVRRRCRHARGAYRPRPEPAIGAVTEALGDRALASYTHHRGELVAVTVAGGKIRLTRACAYREVLRVMEALRFCIHRLARRHGSAESLAAARAGVARAGARLEELLTAPLARQIGDRELVVAPTGRLHAMPWSALPSLSERPVTVTPSAAAWLEALRADRPRTRPTPVLVAGPHVEHAGDEIAAVAARYPEAAPLSGAQASVEAVRPALDGADLAHLAAHGRFRGDNPLFSSILLADGPLMVYDIERLVSAPRRVVLSACDAAVSAVRPGGELMGLASALLSLGTASLVASVSPVHDEETRDLMAAFHDRLAAGHPPAGALAEAARTSGVLGFSCFGAG